MELPPTGASSTGEKGNIGDFPQISRYTPETAQDRYSGIRTKN